MRVRRVLLWLVIAFLVYAVYRDPQNAADAVGSIWDVIQTAFFRLIDFFNALMRQ